MIHYLLTQEADPCLILKRTLTRAFGTPWRRDVPCDSPVRECWEWHIRPRLKSPRSSAGGIGARALCPAHDDREPSLSIGIGDNGRITWQCFACKNRKLVRAALIRECGIDPGCLPLVAREKRNCSTTSPGLPPGTEVTPR